MRPTSSNGLHAGPRNAFLKFRGDGVELLQSIAEVAVLDRLGVRSDLVAAKYKLAHLVHQLVEKCHGNSHIAGGSDGRWSG